MGIGIWSSLALDSAELPHLVSYAETADRGIKYTTYNGLEWITEAIPTDVQTGAYSDYARIAIDAFDNIHMSVGYHLLSGEVDIGFLRYSRRDVNGSSSIQIDSQYSIEHSMALDRLGLPHIAYLQPLKGSYVLEYASVSMSELSGEAVTYSIGTNKGKKSVNAQVLISNNGTQSIKKSDVAFYISDNDIFEPGDLRVGKAAKISNLLPGQSRTISFSIPYTATMSGKKLLAVIDSAKAVSEINEGNNVIVIGTLP